MALPPTSRLRFVDSVGEPLPGPREWTQELVELELNPQRLSDATLFCQSAKLPLFAQDLGGRVRVLAAWPRTGTGRYRLRFELGDELIQETVYEIAPIKISRSSYQALINDLQGDQLPTSLAVGLEWLGGLTGLELRKRDETTATEELLRLQRAIDGWAGKTGLITALSAIARDPHRHLVKTEQWMKAERVRRLEPVGLVAALRRADNLDPETRLPLRVPDVRVEHSLDVYENRLVRMFHQQVDLRLRRLQALFIANQQLAGVAETEALIARLQTARQEAAFLDDVSLPSQPPTRLTMVLLQRAPYRAVLERYLEFRREAYVHLDEPGLDLPLENLPRLYELWGTLQVLDVVLAEARDRGYDHVEHRIARQIGQGVYVKVLADGRAAVTLRRSKDGRQVRVIPQRTFGRTGSHLRSISFSQRPDVVVEVADPDQLPNLLVFDPKYKLRSEEQTTVGESEEDRVPSGQPKKIDIDTMHAYRDAIRGGDADRIVSYAAILYPGAEVLYEGGIEALTADPARPELLRDRLREVIGAAIA
jgi:predicted component of viral defense system (DUF524 family)